MSTPQIRPIPTTYNGQKYRSRTEARWAHFFTTLGIPFEYEAEGYQLPSGPYLPDFWLPTINQGSWLEVKGTTPTNHEIRKAAELSEHTGSPAYITSGGLPRLHDHHQPATWIGAAYERPSATYANWTTKGFTFQRAMNEDWAPGTEYPYTLPHCITACPLCGVYAIVPGDQSSQWLVPSWSSCNCPLDSIPVTILEHGVEAIIRPTEGDRLIGKAFTAARNHSYWEPTPGGAFK